MTRHFYFDANPLVSWADARVATPTGYDTKVAGRVTSLIGGQDATAISEITLLEVHSKICDHWRDTGRPEHDDAWAYGAIADLMGWIRDGTVAVLASPPKLAEMALVNVEAITRASPVQLRAWDAAHLFQAVAWSRSLGEKVTIVTADADYQRVLEAFREFERHIELLDPGG